MAKKKSPKKATVVSGVRSRRRSSTKKSRQNLPDSVAFLAEMPTAVRASLAQTMELQEFRQTEVELSQADRLTLIEQALILFEQNYVHLPLKSSIHAVDPVQRLKLLQNQTEMDRDNDSMTDQQFHAELLSIFLSVRDLHTNYILPAPYNRMIAFVPFFIEEYYEDDQRRYLVSGLIRGFDEPPFATGVEIIRWNGIQMTRAVELNGERFAGSNEEACRARGVETMTIRSLSGTLPPDEDYVLIEYRTPDGQEHELRVDWMVFSPDTTTAFGTTSDPELEATLAMDEELKRVRDAKKVLFVPEVVTAARKAASRGDAVPANLGLSSNLPDTIEAREVETNSGTFGYVRIRTFAQRIDNFVPRFIAEFIRLVDQLPREGLIIDVRGNGGGYIHAGELLLQLLSPNHITPEPAQFINTTLNLQMAEHNSFLQEWVPSIRNSVRSAASFSRGFPITPEDAANSIGQIYHGPVVLITDALCYSTTDIFAAGFQDHDIGPILGVDGNTGAGGANVFTHSDIIRFFLPPSVNGSPYRRLPNGANMRVSIRRTLRVGERSGEIVEDFGVVPNERHYMTRNDLLNSNVDLIEHAAELIADQPIRRLDATITSESDDELTLTVTTRGISRIDVYGDDRPVGSVDVTDGATELEVSSDASLIRLEGFVDDELVASRKVDVNS